MCPSLSTDILRKGLVPTITRPDGLLTYTPQTGLGHDELTGAQANPKSTPGRGRELRKQHTGLLE